MQTVGCPPRSSASTTSRRWRPRPPWPSGAEHETTVRALGSACSWAAATVARQLALPTDACDAACACSVDPVIAPQAHQVTVEVLAERHHLSLEAAAQFRHHAL